jgi:hypothetical protein
MNTAEVMMAAGWDWKCTHRGYRVTTSGPHEFYRDDEGNRKPYGHPVPMSHEAARCGIKGFSTLAYCPTCDTLRDEVIMEFDGPAGVLDAFRRVRDVTVAYKDIGGLHECICPECKGKLLDMLTDVECPRCKKGVFDLAGNWVS